VRLAQPKNFGSYDDFVPEIALIKLFDDVEVEVTNYDPLPPCFFAERHRDWDS
jgi:hypothetical protein